MQNDRETTLPSATQATTRPRRDALQRDSRQLSRLHEPVRAGPASDSRDLSDRRFQRNVKRTIDFVASAVMLLTLGPAFVVVGLLVKGTSPGPIIFRQARIGRNARPFTIYKFRTMVDDPALSGPGSHLHDEQRVTRVGRFLRKTSLDELPQLWNVLKGDMSLVGPRPDLPHHVDGYTPAQRERLDMRPGITGWAQVNGRNQITWAERMELDVDYVRRWSLVLDVVIVIRTLLVVLAGKGADATVKRRAGRRKDRGEK